MQTHVKSTTINLFFFFKSSQEENLRHFEDILHNLCIYVDQLDAQIFVINLQSLFS